MQLIVINNFNRAINCKFSSSLAAVVMSQLKAVHMDCHGYLHQVSFPFCLQSVNETSNQREATDSVAA